MLKTYDDLVENFHKLPIAVAEDIYQRISDWLGSGAAMWLIPRWEEVFALKNTLKAPELLKAKIRELAAELMIVAAETIV